MRYGKLRKKERFALVFWPETAEITSVLLSDLIPFIKDPSLRRKGWRGELPWLFETGETEIFEAQIVKLSYNKDQIDSIVVNCWGEIVQPKVSDILTVEMKNIKKNLKSAQTAQKSSKKTTDKSVKNMTVLFQNEDSAFDQDSDTDDEVAETSQPEPETSPKQPCNGFCLKLAGLVTPENVGFLETLTILMRGELKQEPLVKDPDVRVTLHAGTTLRMSEIRAAHAKSGGKRKNFMWELFQLLIPNHMIQKDSTADAFPKARLAITTYINSRKGLEGEAEDLTFSIYNKAVNSRLRTLKIHKFGTEEEIATHKAQRKVAAAESRKRKKVEEKTGPANKKLKGGKLSDPPAKGEGPCVLTGENNEDLQSEDFSFEGTRNGSTDKGVTNIQIKKATYNSYPDGCRVIENSEGGPGASGYFPNGGQWQTSSDPSLCFPVPGPSYSENSSQDAASNILKNCTPDVLKNIMYEVIGRAMKDDFMYGKQAESCAKP